MIHKHQFVKAYTVEMPRNKGNTSIHATIDGTRYVCLDPECGETRDVWSTGSVITVKTGLPDRKE